MRPFDERDEVEYRQSRCCLDGIGVRWQIAAFEQDRTDLWMLLDQVMGRLFEIFGKPFVVERLLAPADRGEALHRAYILDDEIMYIALVIFMVS